MSDHSQLERLLTWLAGSLAVIVTLAPPAIFFLLSCQNRSGALESETRVAAIAVTDYVNHNAGLWRFEPERLGAVLHKYVDPRHGSTVVDQDGNRIIRLMPPDLAAPVLSRLYPIYGFGLETGAVEVTVSLSDLVAETALIALVGLVTGVIVFFPLRMLPIRALRRAHRALVDSENAYRQLVELSPDGIYISQDEKIVYINAAGVRLFGAAAPEALVGTSVWDRIHPDSRSIVRKRLKHLHAAKTAVPLMEQYCMQLNGTVLPVEVAAAPFVYKGKLALQVVVHDLTERKRTEEVLRQSRDAAEAANRAKSRFLANMSHEIRTPINGVLGMAQLLAEQTNLTDHQRHYLDVLKDSGATLLRVIDEILDFSKIEAGKFTLSETVFDLKKRIADTLRMLAPQAERKRLALDWEMAADVPITLRGDPSRLHQVLANLVSNAIKFTQHGGVRVEVALDGNEEIDGVETDMRRLRFSVQDTGIGIAEDARAYLFQPFAQADDSTTRKYGGTGLGLVISKQIVEMMGGMIGYESIPGEGTSFWFTVCLVVAPNAVELSVRPGEIQQLAGRVLLVEDNPVNCVVAEEMLKSLGMVVKLAANGREALEIWGENYFDVILMDCQMPEMDGLEATLRIRAQEEAAEPGCARSGPTPIIALTANAFSEDRERCFAVGMNDYLSKPFSRDDLYGTLKRWVSGQRCETHDP